MTHAAEPLTQTTPAAGRESRVPLRYAVSDLWRAPLTDLPVREEIIRQFIPLHRAMDVLEAGPGCGFPAWRMARCVGSLTLLEVSQGNAANLERRFAAQPHVRVIADDLCRVGLGAENRADFDAITCVEVLEFLPDAATAVRNLGTMLRPGGVLYLQFPNYENKAWPTFYRTRQQLDEQLAQAGFASWQVFALRLSPWAQRLYAWMHEFPLRVWRRREQKKQRRPDAPLIYEQTWAFHHGSRFERLKFPLHVYWAMVMLLMRAGGEVFLRSQCDDEILNRNLLVVAHAAKDGKQI